MVYPGLWIGTSFFSLVQLLSQPLWALLFVIDKNLFIWGEEKGDKSEKYYYYPREGLPYVLAKAWNIYGLLWSDSTYLVDNKDLSVRFEDFV